MSLLQPKLAILDETDSGLDIDALRVVAEGVQRLRHPERSMLLITHYPRMLEYVRPDRVHVLDRGRIVRSGDHTLATELETTGYGVPAGAGAPAGCAPPPSSWSGTCPPARSEEHTSELQSLMRISYAVFCL